MLATLRQVRLGERHVDVRVSRSRAARHLRVRVGPNGVEVVQPAARDAADVLAFLTAHEAWILDQLLRVEGLRQLRRPSAHRHAELLFRGEPTRVRVEVTGTRTRGNVVEFVAGEIVLRRGPQSRTPLVRSLENWLRAQARAAVEQHLSGATARAGVSAGRVYIMGQRTKWGNCSARGNLSFNWRLVLAPDYVLRYLVTHEAVHLAVPDHSAKFWLALQSIYPGTERARQWLCRHETQLNVRLGPIVDRAIAHPSGRSSE